MSDRPITIGQRACQEARIVSGLKRPSIGKPASGAGGAPAGAGGWVLRAAVLSGAAVARSRPAMRRLGGWARGRQLSPGTLNAVSLLLALCAAIWLSGGPVDQTPGLLALGGSVVAMAGAGRLAAFLSRDAGREASRDAGREASGEAGRTAGKTQQAGRRAAVADDSTDWLTLPGVGWAAGDDDVMVVVDRDTGTRARPATVEWPAGPESPIGAGRSASAGSSDWPRQPGGSEPPAEARLPGEAGMTARDYRWVAALSALAAQGAVYGGMAAGGAATGPAGMWPLAVLTIVSAGTADLLGACRMAGPGRRPAATTWAGRLPALPGGARLALAGLVFALVSPQAALLAVAGADVLAMAWMVVTLGRISPASGAA
ncbi:MAG TPA: hypothetical protein VF843_06440, partial [Streptosporangiaceae bacterium]